MAQVAVLVKYPRLNVMIEIESISGYRPGSPRDSWSMGKEIPNMVDVSKGPIERSVFAMVRLTCTRLFGSGER